MAMLWVQQILLEKAAFADVPRLLRERVRALLVRSGMENLVEQ